MTDICRQREAVEQENRLRQAGFAPFSDPQQTRQQQQTSVQPFQQQPQPQQQQFSQRQPQSPRQPQPFQPQELPRRPQQFPPQQQTRPQQFPSQQPQQPAQQTRPAQVQAQPQQFSRLPQTPQQIPRPPQQQTLRPQQPASRPVAPQQLGIPPQQLGRVPQQQQQGHPHPEQLLNQLSAEERQTFLTQVFSECVTNTKTDLLAQFSKLSPAQQDYAYTKFLSTPQRVSNSTAFSKYSFEEHLCQSSLATISSVLISTVNR